MSQNVYAYPQGSDIRRNKEQRVILYYSRKTCKWNPELITKTKEKIDQEKQSKKK